MKFYFPILERRKYFNQILLYTFLFIALAGIIWYLEFPKIIAILIVLFGLLIISISYKVIEKRFTQNLCLIIDQAGLIIKLTDLKEIEIETINLSYCDINSFSISFINNIPYFYEFTLFLNNRKLFYVFKATEETNNALTTFTKKIVEINKNTTVDKIEYKEAFFATKKGLLAVKIFSFCFLVAFILHITFIPKSSFGTLFISVGTLANLIGLRKNGLKINKIINEGNIFNF